MRTRVRSPLSLRTKLCWLQESSIFFFIRSVYSYPHVNFFAIRLDLYVQRSVSMVVLSRHFVFVLFLRNDYNFTLRCCKVFFTYFLKFFEILFKFSIFFSYNLKTCSAIENLTGNELSKQNKYDYLKDSKGQKKNIFSKGKLYNIKYYFHLVEPHYLETPEFDSHPNYNV